MNCTGCRQVLEDEARFCSGCGASTAGVREETDDPSWQETLKDERAVDPLIGRVLDAKYEVIERLGEGGMGAVYRARRLHIGDEIAVKALHQRFVLDAASVERFRREARSAAMIRHANVVTIHDFGEAQAADAPAYIVMELVRGVSLREVLKREKRFNPQRAVALMRDICAGVGVAHRQGVVHRDLKPDNVIVVPPADEGERETAKVVDFGLAKLRDMTTEFNLTQTGAVVGTPYYMSPEQCQDGQLDARADVYSLGVMLYEMLAGAPPFQANSLAGIIAKHLNEAPPALPPSLAIPPALEAVCRRALAKNPDERQTDAAELNRECQTALTESNVNAQVSTSAAWRTTLQTGTPTLPTLPATPPRERQSNWMKWAIAGFGALLLLGAVIVASVIKYMTVDLAPQREASATNVSSEAHSNEARPMNESRPLSDDMPVETSEAGRQTESESVAPSAKAQNLKGTWTGTYGPLNIPATLIIKEQQGDKLSGVLEQGSVRVAFTGKINPASRQLAIEETKVLRGDGWSLGKSTGELSADGRQMSGTGADAFGAQLGMSYNWSFSR